MKFSTLLLVLGLSALSLSAIRADTLVLKSGKKLEGAIVSQSRFQIRIRTAEGVKNISKSAVRRLIYGGTPKPKPEKEPEKKPEKKLDLKLESLKKLPELKLEAINRPTASKSGTHSATPEELAALQKKLEEARKRAEEERKRIERERERERIRKEKARRKRVMAKYRLEVGKADGAFWRSVVFPGWGQYHLGANRKAAIFGGAAVGAGAMFFVSNSNYNQAVANFEASSNLAVLGANNTPLALVGHMGAEEAKAGAKTHGQQAVFFALGYLGVYLFNLYDVRSDRPTEPVFPPIKSRLFPNGLSVWLQDDGLMARDPGSASARQRNGRPNRGLSFAYSLAF